MTRRYKPTSIPATHAVTQREEWLRERERPKPPREATPAPAEWEASPEPDPVSRPKHGRPPRGLQLPAPTYQSPVLRGFDKALQQTSDPAVKRRLRIAQREMSAQISREIAQLPPGADPAAYGY